MRLPPARKEAALNARPSQRKVGAGSTAMKLEARLVPLAKLVEQKRLSEVVCTARELLKTLPTHPFVLRALSYGLLGQECYLEALPVLEQAIRLHPRDPELHNNLGICLSALSRSDEALGCFDRALALNAADPELWYNKGAALCFLSRWDEAIPLHIRAIELYPGDYDAAMEHLAAALLNTGRYEEALACFSQLVDGEPQNLGLLVGLIAASLMQCKWDGLDAAIESLSANLAAADRDFPMPFFALALPGLSSAELRRIGEVHARFALPEHLISAAVPDHGWRLAAGGVRRLRVGYLSYDLQNHAVAYLLPQVMELHDRDRVESFAYSMGPDDGSEIRLRLASSFDHFVDIRTLGIEASARRIADDEIDILVDMQGWTLGARPGLLALRPAPIQVNWLGYAGTLGSARLADYLIGDSIVTPPEYEQYFTERIVRLPHCYMPLDTTQVVAAPPSRAEAGLPEGAFIFCSLNRCYKFNPQVFDIWCRLLLATPESCLWLTRPKGRGAENLIREIVARGVVPERIVFAGHVDSRAVHLARLQLADLALDPSPYTSHSSGMDALWAGVPMISLLGDTFAGRVGASLLNAAELPECISRSWHDYLQLGIDLYRQPERLREIRQRLLANRSGAPLFDMRQFVRSLEDAYFRMMDEYQQSR